jgi:putative transposon-encoded protein
MFKLINFSMRKIEIKNKKIMQEDDIEKVYEEIIKPIGNGAMIMSEKKYIGKKVYVIIRK